MTARRNAAIAGESGGESDPLGRATEHYGISMVPRMSAPKDVCPALLQTGISQMLTCAQQRYQFELAVPPVQAVATAFRV